MKVAPKIKKRLLRSLKNEQVFWSYGPKQISIQNISDELLIVKTLTHLDIEYIDLLLSCYNSGFIKKVLREQMVIQVEFLLSINRFLAWYYFGVKKSPIHI